jgi:hypothetical protein
MIGAMPTMGSAEATFATGRRPRPSTGSRSARIATPRPDRQVPAVLMPPPSAVAARFATALPVLGADFVQTCLKSALPGYVIGCLSGLGVAILAVITATTAAFDGQSKPNHITMIGAMPTMGSAEATFATGRRRVRSSAT